MTPPAQRLPGFPAARVVRALIERLGGITTGAGGLVPAAPPVSVAEIMRRFWPFVRRDRAWLLVGVVPTVLLPVIATVEIGLFQVVVDDVLAPHDPRPFPALAAAFLGLSLASGAVAFVDDVIAVRIAQRFTLAVRTGVMAHLLRMPPDRLDQRRLGDLLARLSGDVGAIEGFVVGAPSEALAAVAQIALFAIAMLLIDVQLGLVALVLAPCFWGTARLFASAIRRVARERRRRSGAQLAMAEEALAHTALVQAAGQEQAELSRFVVEGEAMARAALASTKLRSSLMPIVDLLEVAGAILVMWLGVVALADGRLSLGELLVTLTYLTQLNRPVSDIAGLVTGAYAAAGGAERVLEILDDQPSVVEHPGARDPGIATGHVRLEHVGYRYGRGREVLSDVTVAFEPGTVTAIVGPSGSGKSTLLKLLLRFADPDQGRVLLDGHDVRDLTLRGLRRNVGALLQDVHVFDRSLIENVRYARPDASDEEVRDALRAAEVAGFAAELPEGELTTLSQRGRRLSGGQRQRIAIARLLLQAAPVVILDEPTASLDAETARRVMAALRVLLQRSTVIIATHDPVAVEMTDRVLRLDNGRVVEAASATGPPGDVVSPAADSLAIAERSYPGPGRQSGHGPGGRRVSRLARVSGNAAPRGRRSIAILVSVAVVGVALVGGVAAEGGRDAGSSPGGRSVSAYASPTARPSPSGPSASAPARLLASSSPSAPSASASTAPNATAEGAMRAFFEAFGRARRTGDPALVLPLVTSETSEAYRAISAFLNGEKAKGRGSVVTVQRLDNLRVQATSGSAATVTFDYVEGGYDIDLASGRALEPPRMLPPRLVTASVKRQDARWLLDSYSSQP